MTVIDIAECKISTGYLDKRGKQICLDDIVLSPEGFKGKIIFAYAAYRYALLGSKGRYLQYDSSLIFSDHHKPAEFEIVEECL